MDNLHNTLLNCKLAYILCDKGELHQGEVMNFVCLDNNCKSNGLICSICKSQMHIKHKKFLAEILKKYSNKDQQIPVEENLKILDEIHKEILSELGIVVKKLAINIKNFEEEAIKNYNLMRQKILSQVSSLYQIYMSQNLPNVINKIVQCDFNDPDYLQNQIRKIIHTVKIDSKQNIELQFKPYIVIDQLTKKKQYIIAQFKKLQQNFEIYYKNLKNAFSQQFISKLKPNYFFSKTLKAPNISLKNQVTAFQTNSSNNDHRFILIEPPLDLNVNSVIKLNVNNLANWIGVGMCFKSILVNKNYKFEYNNIGHGSYLISNNGYTWSHSTKAQNMISMGFSFKTNDKITLEFNHTTYQLKIKSNQNQLYKFIINNKCAQYRKDNVCFCANLCSQNDTLQILN